MSKSRNSLSPGTSRLDPRLLRNHFDFFSLLLLVCRLIHPYRLPNNLRLRYKFRIFRSNLLAGFSLCPHYTISFGFQAVLKKLDCISIALLCRFARLRQSCSAKCNSRCFGLAFLFVFLILPGLPTDAKPPDDTWRWCVSTRSQSTTRPSRRSCMPFRSGARVAATKTRCA